MIQTRVRISDETRRVRQAVKKANVKSLDAAGAYVRGIARRSIKVAPTASKPGKPPHSRRGLLKDAIVFGVDRSSESVTIGPAASAVGRKVAGLHEFGGTARRDIKPNWRLQIGGHGPMAYRRGKLHVAKIQTRLQLVRATRVARDFKPRTVNARYPERPYMSKALGIAVKRLPENWARSVKA